MTSYNLSPEAQRDFRAIRDWYRAKRGPRSARKVAEDIRSKLRLLAEQPGIGTVREHLAPTDTNFFPHRHFLIVYLPESTPLEVLRIWDVRRGDPPQA